MSGTQILSLVFGKKQLILVSCYAEGKEQGSWLIISLAFLSRISPEVAERNNIVPLDSQLSATGL